MSLKKRFNFYPQQDQMDCGPTCLRMIAKHYGKSIAIDTLRRYSGIGKEGVNLLGIAEAAETIGFRTQGVQLSLAQLQTDATLPCILHWSQQHFVVLYKIRRRIYYLADPAVGHVKLTANEFARRWLSAASPSPSKGGASDPNDSDTNRKKHGFQNPPLEGREALGIALLLEPTPNFYNSEFDDAFTETGSKGFGSVVKYLYPYNKLLLQLMLGVVLGSLLQLVLPFLTKSIVDTGISTNNLPFLYIILFAQLALFTGRLMVDFIRSWLLYHISSRINISILTDF
jgi:ATP-binding cassette, subfamily B, bacterial